MVAFLKSLDNKAWKAVLTSWEHPVITKEGEATTDKKAEEQWTKEEDDLALGNSKALNVIFNGVDKNILRLVNNCEVAKDAWNILKTTHEGTSRVKMSRLQLLTTKFENLRMKEDENIHEFHMNILEIANASGALGEKMSDEKPVRKILRSLPKRFAMKVTTIEESQDISNMRVDELIGSLQTFDMGMCDGSEKKFKSIAFMSNNEEKEEECGQDTDEDLENDVALLGRQFNKLLNKMDVRSKSNVKNISSDISKSNNAGRRTRSDEKSKEGKGVQCHECDGYGHIRAECGTYLKKQKKSLTATWSNESETEESANLVTALTGRWGSYEDSSDDEVTFDELATTYRKLCHRSEEVCQQVESQKKVITQLENEKVEHLETISKLKTEAVFLNSKLDEMTKYVRMLNNGSDTLDKILHTGQMTGDKSGIRFNESKPECSHTGSKPKSKPECSHTGRKPKMSHHISQHHKGRQQKGKHQRWRCHYCGKFGHIKPFCYKLYDYPSPSHHQPRPKHHIPVNRKQWVPRNSVINLIANTSFRVSAKEDWYFDSGCSRHMTGNKNLLTGLHPHATIYVTFGDGAKGEIKGIGKINCPGVPNLDNVLLVKGLTANLISISQLCDQGLTVNFTKTECLITNK
ncbi:uncharacterized protein LOC127084755 [Lathyrus oleraceus]|uniref:uncharacterized protein LOC127084755 n=1 Tax=Pisum sativum TaxID=3888 RepID=UPI0021D0603C|nr:uncharacterized protein LOC127084755 [Pisum sativum]